MGRAAFCWGLWTGPDCVPEPFPRAHFPWNSSTLGPRFLMNHSTRGRVGISEREHTCGAWIHMEINRKTKLRFPAPGGRKLPLPDLGTTGYIRKHFPGVRLPAPPQSAVPMLRSGRNRSRVPLAWGLAGAHGAFIEGQWPDLWPFFPPFIPTGLIRLSLAFLIRHFQAQAPFPVWATFKW